MKIRVYIAAASSILWVGFWVVQMYCNWAGFSSMNPNEWGDFFAGAFAPLAFLWLVVGYFQQGYELSQNTRALEQQEKSLALQVEELSNSVKQQKDLVDINKQEFELRSSQQGQLDTQRRHAAKPIFAFAGGSGLGGSVKGYKVKIINKGQSISALLIKPVFLPVGVAVVPYKIPRWEAGQAMEFQFRYDHGFEFEKGDNFDVELEFTDSLGEQSEATLYFYATSAQALQFSDVVFVENVVSA